MAHSNVHSGLQSHSIGPLYPWSIVVYKKPRKSGYCRAENLITGEYGPKIHFRHGNKDSFYSAHDRAETWIVNVKDYSNAMVELSELGYGGLDSRGFDSDGNRREYWD